MIQNNTVACSVKLISKDTTVLLFSSGLQKMNS